MKLRNSISAVGIWLVVFTGEDRKIVTPPVLAAAKVNPADEFCGIRNTAFQAGEQVTFHVYYSVVGAYIHAGTATFTTTLGTYANKPVYHVVGDGKTKSSYDWIYRVRDKYETITFNRTANTAVTNSGVFKVPNCVQDVLSAMYYARNVDFAKYKVEDKIPFKMFLDNEVFDMYIRYLGKETVKTQYGKFRAIKFKPLLLKGTIFEGGEKMTVWVSDDPNRVVLRVESPIVVGKVKIDMMSYRNLRYPLTSMVKLKGSK